MESESTIQIVCVVLGAILAYGFGRYQHTKDYKEELKHKIFDTLLLIDLPDAYIDFIENPKSNETYNKFSSYLKDLVKRCSILQLKNSNKYLLIKETVLLIDDLSGFNEYHLVDGIKIPKEITEIKAIEKRKSEIDKQMKKLYRIIGVDNYRNVLYSGKIKYFKEYIYDCFHNRKLYKHKNND